MAGERIVSWKAVANFAQVTREAAKTERALKSLKKTQQDFNAAQGGGSGTTAAGVNKIQANSLDALTKATQEYTRARIAANKANTDSSKTTVSAPLAAETKATRDLSTAKKEDLSVTDELASARQAQVVAMRQEEKAVRGVDAAYEAMSRTAKKLTAPAPAAGSAGKDKGAQSAAQALVAARNAEAAAAGRVRVAELALQEVRAKSGATASQVASAEERLENAHRRYVATQERVVAVTQRAARSHNDAGSSARRLGSDLDGLRDRADGAGNGIGNLGGALRRLEPSWNNNGRGAFFLGSALRLMLVPLVITGINLLASLLSPLAAGFIGLAGAIAPAAGLLATLPGILAAVGGGMGTLIAGFAGIGGALKAYGTQQKNQVKQAGQVEKATKRQAVAQKANTRAVRDNRDQVASAARAIKSAQQTLADAHLRERDAQKAVTQARIDARLEVERMRKSLKDLALQEEGSSLTLEEARNRLREVNDDPGSTDLERRQADLAVREAEARLQDVRDQQDETSKQLKTAQKKGVEGSDQVVAAKRAESDAHRSVIDAQQNLLDAQRQATRSQDNLTDAIAKTGGAAGDAGIATAAAAGQVDVFKEAMSKLTPEAQAVVYQLLKMKPLIDAIRATAQRGLMPGVLSFLIDITKLFPVVNTFVGRAANSFGNFFERVGKALTTRSALRDWGKVLGSTNEIIDIFLAAAFNIGLVLARILIAARPLTKWFALSVKGWTDTWEAMTSGEQGQERLVGFFKKVRRSASLLGDLIKNLAGTLYNLGKGASDTGFWILESFNNMAEGWKKWTGSVEGQNQIKKWADDARPVLSQVAGLIGDVVQGILDLGKKTDIASIIKQIRDQLLPAILSVFALFTGEAASHIVSILSGIGSIISTLAGVDGGGINVFLSVLDKVITATDNLITNFPILHNLLGGLLALMAGKAAVNFASRLLGVGGAVKTVKKVVGATRVARGTDAKSVSGRAADAKRAGATRVAQGLPRRTAGPRRAVDETPRRAAPGATSGGRGAGRNIVSGLAGGISSSVKGALSAITNAIRSVIAKAKSLLGIRSPSRVFYTIGQQIAQGLINGMNSLKGTVSKTSAGVVGGAVTSGKGAAAVAGRGGRKGAKGGSKAASRGKKGGGGGKADAAADALGGVALAASFLPGPLGAIASVVLNVISVLSMLAPVLLSIGGAFLKFLPVIGRVALGFARFIPVIGIVITVLAIAVPLIIKHWDAIKNAFMTAITAIMNFVRPAWEGFIGFISGPLNAVIAFVKFFAASLWSIIVLGFNLILTFIKIGWGLFQIFVLRPIQFVLSVIGALIALIGKAIMSRLNAILMGVKLIWALFKSYILQPIINTLAPVVAAIGRIASSIFSWIKETVDSVREKFARIMSAILAPFQPILTKVGEFLGKIKDKFDDFVTKVGKALSPLGKVVTDAFYKIKAAVSDPIKFAIDVINGGIINPYIKLAGLFGIKTDVKAIEYDIPKLQSGGKVAGGQQATRDNVLGISRKTKQPTAYVEPGEFIMPRSKRQYFPMLEAIRQGKNVGGALPGFKAGGYFKPIRGSISQGLHGGYTGFPAIDFSAPVGTPVNAVADGRVSRSTDIKGNGNEGYASYGRYIQIVSKGFETLYAHLSQRRVKSGQTVSAGQQIADSGNTGNSTGPHLHFGSKGMSPYTFVNGQTGKGKGLGAVGDVVSDLPNPLTFLTDAFGKVKDTMAKIGDSPFGKVVTQYPKKILAGAKDKAKDVMSSPVVDAISGVVGAVSGALGSKGRAAARTAALQLGASSVGTYPGHQPSMNKAWDFMSSGATGQRIADHMAANRKKYGISYIIWNRRILRDYAKPGIPAGAWAPYFDGNSSNPNRAHTNHVHTSYYARGTNSARRGPAVVGENGPELVYMNGGERVVNNNLTRRELPKYHAGGVVNGMKEGAKGDWVRAIRSEAHLGTSNTWTKALSAYLRKNIPSIGTNSFANYNKSDGLINSVVKLLKKTKKNLSIDAIARALKLDQTTVWQNSAAISAALKKQKASTSDQSYFKKTSSNFGKARTNWLKSLQAKTGETKDGVWSTDSNEPVQHALYHALKMPHDAFMLHPWQKNTDVENAVQAQRRSNKINAEFDGLINTFTSWSLTNLARKMTETGPAEGLTLARNLSKNRSAATAYDKDLGVSYAREDAKSGSDDRAAKMRTLVSALSGTTAIGLQAAAKAVSLSLDSTAALYDEASAKGLLKSAKTTRISKEVVDFKKLFKFATGGKVPGFGNGDRVNALLEPGEFVVRRAAVKELESRYGPSAMDYFNNIDRFSAGGFAGGMSLPSYRGSSVNFTRSGSSDTTNVGGKSVVNNFNTNINNPTLEDGAVSVQKRITRVAQLGLLNGGDR